MAAQRRWKEPRATTMLGLQEDADTMEEDRPGSVDERAEASPCPASSSVIAMEEIWQQWTLKKSHEYTPIDDDNKENIAPASMHDWLHDTSRPRLKKARRIPLLDITHIS